MQLRKYQFNIKYKKKEIMQNSDFYLKILVILTFASIKEKLLNIIK